MCVWGNVNAGLGAEGRWGIWAVNCRDAQAPGVYGNSWWMLGVVLRAGGAFWLSTAGMHREGQAPGACENQGWLLGTVLRAGRAFRLAVVGTHSQGQVLCRRGAGRQFQGWAWGPDKEEAGVRSCSCSACRAQGCCSHVACLPNRCSWVAPAKRRAGLTTRRSTSVRCAR